MANKEMIERASPIPLYECDLKVGDLVRIIATDAGYDPADKLYVVGVEWRHQRGRTDVGWNITIASAANIEKGYGACDGWRPDDLRRDYSVTVDSALTQNEDVAGMVELVRAAKDASFWLEGALTYEKWIWDDDQREAAELTLASLNAAHIARCDPDTIRSISDAYKAMEERAEKAEIALAMHPEAARAAELPDFMVALHEWGCDDPNEQADAIREFLAGRRGLIDYQEARHEG